MPLSGAALDWKPGHLEGVESGTSKASFETSLDVALGHLRCNLLRAHSEASLISPRSDSSAQEFAVGRALGPAKPLSPLHEEAPDLPEPLGEPGCAPPSRAKSAVIVGRERSVKTAKIASVPALTSASSAVAVPAGIDDAVVSWVPQVSGGSVDSLELDEDELSLPVHYPQKLRIGKQWKWGNADPQHVRGVLPTKSFMVPSPSEEEHGNVVDRKGTSNSHDLAISGSRHISQMFKLMQHASDNDNDTSVAKMIKPMGLSEKGKGAVIDLMIGIVIVLNTLTIGISVDHNPDWIGWQALEFVFACIFLLDIVYAMYRHGIRKYFTGVDYGWHIYEFLLVLFAFTELTVTLLFKTSGTSSVVFATLRVMRLLRIARIVRIARLPVFAELIMMIHGAIGGVRTLLWSQLLLVVPLYVVALVYRETLGQHAEKGNGAEYFDTLSRSFFTSFRCLVANDCTTDEGKPIFVIVSEAYGFGFAMFYAMTTVFMVFGLFNVIVAIYVENTVAAAKFNELRQKHTRLTDSRRFAEKALDLCEVIWAQHPNNLSRTPLSEMTMTDLADIHITPEHFDELRSTRYFRDLLRDLDIADEDMVDLFDTLDVDGSGSLDLDELVNGISKLRGDARRSDIISVSLMVRAMQADLTSSNQAVAHMFKRHAKQLHELKKMCRAPASAKAPPPSRTSLD